MSWLILILRFLLGPIWAETLSARWESWSRRNGLCRRSRGSLFGLSFREKLGDPPWPVWVCAIWGRAVLQPVPVSTPVSSSVSVARCGPSGDVRHVFCQIAFPPVAGSYLHAASRSFCGT